MGRANDVSAGRERAFSFYSGANGWSVVEGNAPGDGVLIVMQKAQVAGQDLPRLGYDVRETAFIIGGVSDKTVYRLLQRGLLTANPALRHKIITAESIQKFMGSSERRLA